MKKLVALCFLCVGALLVGGEILSVSAQDTNTFGNRFPNCSDCQGGYVDENQNGICDHREAMIQEDTENKTNTPGQKPNQNSGMGYVDEDGDGVCDRKETSIQEDVQQETVTNTQLQNLNVNQGKGYVDEDGDGVCDQSNAQMGMGMQRRLQKGKNR